MMFEREAKEKLKSYSACVACADGTTNAAGDGASGDDISCVDSSSSSSNFPDYGIALGIVVVVVIVVLVLDAKILCVSLIKKNKSLKHVLKSASKEPVFLYLSLSLCVSISPSLRCERTKAFFD